MSGRSVCSVLVLSIVFFFYEIGNISRRDVFLRDSGIGKNHLSWQTSIFQMLSAPHVVRQAGNRAWVGALEVENRPVDFSFTAGKVYRSAATGSTQQLIVKKPPSAAL